MQRAMCPCGCTQDAPARTAPDVLWAEQAAPSLGGDGQHCGEADDEGTVLLLCKGAQLLANPRLVGTRCAAGPAR